MIYDRIFFVYVAYLVIYDRIFLVYVVNLVIYDSGTARRRMMARAVDPPRRTVLPASFPALRFYLA